MAVPWLLLRASRFRIAASGALLGFAALVILLSPGRPLPETARGRLFTWSVAIPHLLEAPVFGFGPGSFPLKYAEWETTRLASAPPGTIPLRFRIKAKFLDDTRCRPGDAIGEMRYSMEFFRGSEAAPFARRAARLSFSPYDRTPYRFSIQEAPMGGDVQTQIKQLYERMSNRNLTSAERDRIMEEMNRLNQKMMAEMSKLTDPGFIKQMEEQKKQFGCTSVELATQGAQAKGRLTCSDQVGRNIPLEGSWKYTGRSATAE